MELISGSNEIQMDNNLVHLQQVLLFPVKIFKAFRLELNALVTIKKSQIIRTLHQCELQRWICSIELVVCWSCISDELPMSANSKFGWKIACEKVN